MTQTPDGEPATGGGIRALVIRHPVAWLVGAGALVFALLGSAAVAAGVSAGASGPPAPASTPSAPPPAARAQPDDVPSPIALRTCSIADAAADPLLGTLTGTVIDIDSGATLLDRDGTTPHTPANVQQLLTAAAAITTLGPDTTLSTKVVDGNEPGTIVLVGGGDPTLSTTLDSVYDNAPLIHDLADQAMDGYDQRHPNERIQKVILDSSLWDPADRGEQLWPASERTDGYIPYTTALMVDGDRVNGAEDVSPRGDDPILSAGRAFANAADLGGVEFEPGKAGDGDTLAEVQSQPISSLVSQMLMSGDNALAESLARSTSLALGLDGSSASVGEAIPKAMAALGLEGTDSLAIRDGSGTSADNLVSPALVGQLLVTISAGDQGLGPVRDGMPVSGKSGDLADRFTGDNGKVGASVQAKSGWIFQDRSLAGVVVAADGTRLAFVFYAQGEAVTSETVDAIDTLTTAVFDCGANLASN